MVGLLLPLYFQNLTVELVGHRVDRRVEVGVVRFDEEVLAAHVQRHPAFCLELSTDRMTVTLVTLSKWRMTRSSLEVTYSRMAG